MSATLPALKELAPPYYSTMELLGMMTVAMVVALILIALGFRFIHALSAMRKYDEACEKVKEIELRVEEMKAVTQARQEEYEKSIFDLQQTIFDRNSEVLDLKNKILVMNTLTPV